MQMRRAKMVCRPTSCASAAAHSRARRQSGRRELSKKPRSCSARSAVRCKRLLGCPHCSRERPAREWAWRDDVPIGSACATTLRTRAEHGTITVMGEGHEWRRCAREWEWRDDSEARWAGTMAFRTRWQDAVAPKRKGRTRRALAYDWAWSDDVAVGRATQEKLAQGQPNVLRFSCAASLHRNHCQAESSFQNRPDLARRTAASTASAGWAAGPLQPWAGMQQSRYLRSLGTLRRSNTCLHLMPLTKSRQ